MKDSVIKSVDGYLGPHNHDFKLNVGDVQSMVFRPGDDGPYWMTPEATANKERSFWNDRNHKGVHKPQLIKMLQQEGIKNPKGSKQQIKNMAERAGIALTYQKQDILEGWEGKAKGWSRFFGSEDGSIPAKIKILYSPW
ncbi:hypothetical protein MHU86_688 [Fragilaria crotonensis]|nr:hypothetical protein MHU86_688 [Fragilaria crotonensis]